MTENVRLLGLIVLAAGSEECLTQGPTGTDRDGSETKGTDDLVVVVMVTASSAREMSLPRVLEGKLSYLLAFLTVCFFTFVNTAK